MARNHYADEFKQQIVGLYKMGKTPKQLANDYQIGKSTVWRNELNNLATQSHLKLKTIERQKKTN